MRKSSLKITYLVFVLLLWLCSGDEDKDEKKPDSQKSCSKFNLKMLWMSRLRESPLVATPLLIDIDGDSLRDIVAPSPSGEVWAIHGENGHIADNWPIYIEDRSFFASPIAYDIDKDGYMDITLVTTDAEILFVRTNSTPFFGETIKIPPLRVKRDWYSLEKDYIEKLAEELSRQAGSRFHYNPNPTEMSTQVPSEASDHPYSEFESRLGQRNTDPLFSRYYPEGRPSGLDPKDPTYVFVDPHVLATPVLADINEDGTEEELVVPVSYYFDRFQYGVPANLAKTGLSKDQLTNYAASGIVVVNLQTREVRQKLLGITKVVSDQPSYLLAQPTIVRLSKGEPLSIIIGSSAGQLHVLQGFHLTSAPGFPIPTDSITSQIAVEDLTGDGTMELIVGDSSGNVACIDNTGKHIWEYNVKSAVETSPRFTNIDNDSSMEVVIVTKFGDLLVLNGTTGKPTLSTPLSLNSLVHSSPLLIHLSAPDIKYRLSVVVPTITGLYVVDLSTGCVEKVKIDSEFIPHVLQSDHIDPFNPGLEILGSSLSGEIVCLSTGSAHMTDYEVSVETWTGDALEGNGFTHKESSFAVVCGRGLSTRDAAGKTFRFSFEIHDKKASARRPHAYHAKLFVGSKYVLLNQSFIVNESMGAFEVDALAPPVPIQATMTLKVCNEHWQCESVSFDVRFNLIFRENLRWCLAFPFLALVAAYLWLLRNENTVSVLPTVYEPPKRL